MRLNDSELIALSALVYQQAIIMKAENDLRFMNNESPAHRDTTKEADLIQNEINLRIKEDAERERLFSSLGRKE